MLRVNYLEAILKVRIEGELINIESIDGLQTVDEVKEWFVENTTFTSRKYGLATLKFRRVYIIEGKPKTYSKWHKLEL